MLDAVLEETTGVDALWQVPPAVVGYGREILASLCSRKMALGDVVARRRKGIDN